MSLSETCERQAMVLYRLVNGRHPEAPREIRLSIADAREIYVSLAHAASELKAAGK